jgi:predicted nucleic acid-binding protein
LGHSFERRVSDERLLGKLTATTAAAPSLNIRLVTNNVREFKRVPQLRVENWA